MSSAATTDQFGHFDGLDNRKTVFRLFERMGKDKPERVAAAMRGGFLQGLLVLSAGPLVDVGMTVAPCSAIEAYHLFIAITGVLGVNIEEAATLLEKVIRRAES